MKNLKKLVLIVSALAICAGSSHAKKKVTEDYVMEESGTNMTKVTDDTQNSVLGPSINKGWSAKFNFAKSAWGGSKKAGLTWNSLRTLTLSPDGSELAYLTRKNKNDNIMVRRASGSQASTQRTFRNVYDFCWGPDGNLYFSDYVGEGQAKIVSLDAHKGSTMRQLTSNNHDFNPATIDGNLIFFTRMDTNGPSVWSFNKETGELINCARGYQATPISKKEFLCVRNSTDGDSEIWLVNYVDGQETLIVGSKGVGYSNPSLSPDGQWILMQANSKSGSTKKQNLDLFVIRKDGTQLTQLTFHPDNDFCPVWSADGKQIYFISSRGSKDDHYNIWRMNFNLY